jgi:hypothetical protein
MDELGKIGGFGQLEGIGGKSAEPTIEELLTIARMRGGATAEVAEELTHPERSILSTVGKGFKNAFNEFVDVISIPSQIVAGAISDKYTVKEAIDLNKSVSDAIFGETNIFNKEGGKSTTLQKVGNFIVRLPVDILSDPLTYLTFGASAGVIGLKSLPKVTLGAKAIETAGIATKGTRIGGAVSKALSQEGADTLRYLKNIEKQMDGTLGAERLTALSGKGAKMREELLAKGISEETLDFSEKQLKELLKETTEAPLKMDFAKKTMSMLFEHNPALVETFIDKGGIKFFGKSMLSSQRIDSVTSLIPGMTYLDNVTAPFRNSVNALFDTSIVKLSDESGIKYMRLPEEYVTFKQQLKDLSTSMKTDMLRNLSNVQNELGLSTDEWRLVMDGLSVRKMPADPRLAQAYQKMLGVDNDQLAMLRQAGVPIHNLENHTGLVFVPEDTRGFMKNSQFSAEPGAAKRAANAKFIEMSGQTVTQNVPEVQQFIKANPTSKLGKEIASAKSVQDVGYAIGRETDDLVQKLTDDGMSISEALQNAEVKKLQELRTKVDTLPQNKQLVGDSERLGLSMKITDEEIKSITERYTKAIEGKELKAAAVQGELQELTMRVQEFFKGFAEGKFEQLIKTIPSKDRDNFRLFLNKLRNDVGDVDIEKLSRSNEAKKLVEKELKGMSKEAFDKLKAKLERGEELLSGDISDVNLKLVIEEVRNLFDEIDPKDLKKAADGVDTDEEVAKLAKKLETESKGKRYAEIGANIDANAFAKYIKSLKESFEANPDGVRRMLDSFLGKKNQLTDILDSIEFDKNLAKAEIGQLPDLDTFFIDKEGKVFKRVAASASELEKDGFKGFDTNLLTAYTVRGLQNQRQALGQHFMEGLIRNFGKRADEAPEAWIPIEHGALAKKGDNIGIPPVTADGIEYVFHPAIASSFEDMMKGIVNDEISEGFWKGFDKIQKYWKASVTSLFPMFHGRNAISNVFLNMMDLGYEVFNPRTHAMAGDFILKDRTANRLIRKMTGVGDEAVKATQEFTKLMGKEVFTDKTGYTWTYGEIRQAIKESGVAFTPDITGAADIAGDRKALLDFYGIGKTKTQRIKGAINPLNSDTNKAYQLGRETGRLIEEQARLVNFITNLRNTGDVTHAAQRDKQFLFDYSNLTKFEKNTLRRIIPFYSFTRFNLEMQAKTLMSAPGRIGAEIRTVKSLGDVMGGEEISDEEKKLLPTWLGNSIALKRKGKDGGTEIISGFGTPIEQPFQQFQPTSLLGSVSPIVRYPIEAMTGYQFFRGKPTSEVIDARDYQDAPQALRDYIGYVEYEGKTKEGETYKRSISLRPDRMHMITQLPLIGRVMNVFGNMTDDDINADAKALQAITGVTARGFDFEEEERRKEEKLKTELEEVLYKSGVRGKFTRYYNKKNTTPVE